MIGGIVLCGGESRRMGRAKAELPFGDETMLGRVVRIVGEVVGPVCVVAAPDQQLPDLPSHVLIAHDDEPGLGPLAGIRAGLAALRGQVDAAYVSSCDVPLLQPAFVARLVRLLEGHELVVPRDGQYHHPLAAVYRTSLVDRIDALLAADRRRPYFLIEESEARVVDVGELRDVDPELDSLRNLNTPDDYAAALAAAGLPQPTED